MSWIKLKGEPVWWDPDESEMIAVYGPPKPWDTPAVWSSDLPPSEAPFNEVQDDVFVIIQFEWADREGEPAKVVSTEYSEGKLREKLEGIGIPF